MPASRPLNPAVLDNASCHHFVAIKSETIDYVDSGIMERLRHHLTSPREVPQSQVNINEIIFQSVPLYNLPIFFGFKVIARRVEENGKQSVLLRWLPANV